MRSVKLPIGSKKYTEASPVATGLLWEAAKTERDHLQQEEVEAKPMQTCWSRDVYYCERED